jgi:uncharacterized membrane protein YkoI
MLALARAKVTVPEVIVIAQKEVAGGRLVDADLVTVRGTVLYEIEILKGDLHVVRVDLQNGTIVSRSVRRVSPKAWKAMASIQEAKVTLMEAIGIASRELPGGRIASADTSTTSRGILYNVEIEKEGLHVVQVDPEDGRVIGVSERLDD